MKVKVRSVEVIGWVRRSGDVRFDDEYSIVKIVLEKKLDC